MSVPSASAAWRVSTRSPARLPSVSRFKYRHRGQARASFPYGYQWGIWALTFGDLAGASCPSNHSNPYPDPFGLFHPLDPGNPQALGAYRLWFYTREGYPNQAPTDNVPCYENSC